MWQDLVAWFQSPGGARVLQTAIIPALAILIAGLLAAAIARAAMRAVIRRADRVEAASAVGALVAAARGVSDPHGDRGSRRRASRLRTEADVRVRLLPLPGAGTAADWAAQRIDALQQSPEDGADPHELDELRNLLVAWVKRPDRAKRIFAVAPERPAPSTAPPSRAAAAAATADPAPQRSEGAPTERAQEQPHPSQQDEHAVGPRRTPASPPLPVADAPVTEQKPVPDAEQKSGSAAPATAAGPAQPASPAWQRTRAGERLQQERGRTRAVEPPTGDERDEVPVGTAPVQLSHAHRAPVAPAPGTDEAVRLEAHQQAKHARPTDDAPVATGAAPAAPTTSAPAWLDTYDDEAHVTQNLDLTTPPPVAAAAVRDRGAPGDDLVPRT